MLFQGTHSSVGVIRITFQTRREPQSIPKMEQSKTTEAAAGEQRIEVADACKCGCHDAQAQKVPRETSHSALSHQLMRSRIRALRNTEERLQELVKRSCKIVVAQEEFLLSVQGELQQACELIANEDSEPRQDNRYVASFPVLFGNCCEVLKQKQYACIIVWRLLTLYLLS